MSCYVCRADDPEEIGRKNGHRVVRCRNCGFYYVHPLPTPETLREYYSRYGANLKNVRNAAWKLRRFKRKILPLIFFTRGRDFLDIGCNIGFGAEAARRLGCRAVGIDMSDQAIDLARQMYPKNTFHNLSALELADQVDRTFDIVLCSEIIEHLSDIHAFMASLRSLVKPGGILYLTTPDAGHFRVPKDFLSWKEVIPPEHIGFFNRAILQRLLAQYGFRVLYFQPMLKPNLRLLARRDR